MKISERLKVARKESGLTQDQVAEKLYVSRQTISNWENAKSYPDIMNVISLSDLYHISLDDLLKGDPNMTKHLKESTDLVASNRKLIAAIIAEVLLVLAMLVLAAFFDYGKVFMAASFSLAIITTAILFNEIIKRI